MTTLIFKEKQKLDSLWALLVMAVTLGLNWVLFFIFKYDDISFLYKTVIIAALTSAFLSLIKLETEITKEEIKFRLFPIQIKRKIVKIADTADVKIVRFRPIRDYGGWGYRRVRNGKAYIVKGSYGLRIDFKDGQHLLIGTQKMEELGQIFKSK